LLEPADEFGTAKAGIAEEERRGVLGQQASHEGAQASFEFILAVAQASGMIGPKG
jgi:hypothetical protein